MAFFNYLKNCFYFDYRNNIKEFRKLMSNTINLYYEFWSLLYNSKFRKHNKVNELCKLGTNIMKIDLRIEYSYNRKFEAK